MKVTHVAVVLSVTAAAPPAACPPVAGKEEPSVKRDQASEGKALRYFIRRAMNEWSVPGLAIAVVRNRSVVLCEGFGLRDVRGKREATAETLFPVASLTKAFTAMALGVLVDDGTLRWDTPVREYLPEFHLCDPAATERATVRDLLCHRTGMPRHDGAWYGLALSRRELLAKLRHLKPSRDFRSRYQYQNLMYMTAGVVVEAVSGTTWQAFLKERVFGPLGMTATTFYSPECMKMPQFAMPYRRRGDRAVRAQFDGRSSAGAAGSIVSNVADMTGWLIANLNGGTYGGRRIVSAETLKEIHSPQMVVPESPEWPEMLDVAYAMGWKVQPYRGHGTLWHDGLLNGYQAKVGLLPRERTGIVILTNLMGHFVTTLILYHAFDRFLRLKPLSWPKRIRQKMADAQREQTAVRRKITGARAATARPSQPIRNYIGDYVHPGYGMMTIRLEKRELRADWHGISHRLRHSHHDVFELDRPLWSTREHLSFFTDAEGRIDRLAVPLEPEVDPIVFKRVLEPHAPPRE